MYNVKLDFKAKFKRDIKLYVVGTTTFFRPYGFYTTET